MDVRMLESLEPIYFPSEVNVALELFKPIAEHSKTIDCMVGYFTSGSLSELAAPLVAYYNSSDSSVLRLIASPHLSQEDLEVISKAIQTEEDLIPILFKGFELTEQDVRDNTLTALAYLIATKKIEIRIALMSDGLFHTKSWLFTTPFGNVAVSGSSNATKSALSSNFEQLVVSRDWMDDSSAYICSQLKEKFEDIWQGHFNNIKTIKLNDSSLSTLRKIAEIEQPKSNSLLNIVRELEGEYEIQPIERVYFDKLEIPNWLDVREGDYDHQGQAIDCWFDNKCQGILSIATGGGKTLTSLAATAMLTEKETSLLIVVAVPTKPLLDQWEEEVKLFGLQPINTNGMRRKDITFIVKQCLRELRSDCCFNKVVIITHDALASGALDVIEKKTENVKSLLIADEVHNLGSPAFVNKSPNYYDFKLGLSATPIRQLDEEGTAFLNNYFDGVVFEFGLDEAIGKCLVRYDYFAHPVYLTAEEEFDLIELTQQIKKLSYAINAEDGSVAKKNLQRLSLARRRLIESASLKIRELQRVFPNDRINVAKSIIFATDKYPDQIYDVNNFLNSKHVNFHQVTQEETSKPKKLKRVIALFSDSIIQVLTSKRVLDEGFNVPQTEVAYILASSTIKKQWIQRLGRVLRLSKSTGKTHAVIHDFVVIPNLEGMEIDNEFKSVINNELKRVMFFGQLSRNGTDKNGYISVARKLLGDATV